VGDACALPFSDGQFTHAISIEGVVHFNPRERFLREAHRVLGDGGELGMSDFCLGRPPRSAFERLLIRACERAWHVPVANTETVETYAATMERAGLTDVHIEVVSDEVIPGYLAEQARPDVRAAQCLIRGPVAGRLGLVIDWLVRKAYDAGLLAYILASGRKEGTLHGYSSGPRHGRDGRDAPSRGL
jgi:SAM-dependent methyltransferase